MIQSYDLLLKDKVELYNNIAQISDCRGRLTASLEIYPAPKLKWEFESIGAEACDPVGGLQHRIDPIEGVRILIDRTIVTGRS